MTKEEIIEYIRENRPEYPPLSEAQRVRLTVLLRDDLPVGIQRGDGPFRPVAASLPEAA
ncbi:hypothetical protein [Polymorphospora rubra]|uniref:Uncharacterized protein n=1 Tax=Polymorphospora rubra TaxID=338584 RepID=A0A810MYV7_9ACTN|nr:hypothetical protein [Polymorphospora rubra]BCJ65139.1 hypothetical protein Prubr_21600 [Polymorphospora rubra]